MVKKFFILFMSVTAFAFCSPTIYEAEVTLTAAQVRALGTNPIQVIAAPGAGNIVRLISVALKMEYGGNTEFNGSGPFVLYAANDSQKHALAMIDPGNQAMSGKRSFYALTELIQQLSVIHLNASVLENSAINVINWGNISGNSTNDNTIVLSVMYQILTL